MRGTEETRDTSIAPLELKASATDFAYALRLDAERPLVLQGNAGYSRKSERGQASYYYSQPYFKASGRISIGDKPVEVTGLAWMDREWSSQPLGPDQTGWDWFSLHLNSGEKLMLYRLRQQDGRSDLMGNWIFPDGRSVEIASADNRIAPTVTTDVAGRKVPTGWRVVIPAHGIAIETMALNAASWMGTSFPYWEGPIRFAGSHAGLGYLEMTGY
jgi:predicted secreted hydrolase